MVDDRNARVAELFDAVQEVARAQRAAWLDAHCGGDAELRRALERLLAADAREDGVLESGPELIGEVLVDEAAAPEVFGKWRVLGPLGAGGMGEVWLAERDDAGFVQRAAIKQVAWPTPGLLQRFERERQILARLEHPGIARLIDGGVDDAGCPYLAMEHVEGVRIDEWVRERGLGVRATVELLLEVCATVQFAHRNLVVHSDIKPGNILVGGDGKPRLLDFGIAKVLSDEGDNETQTAARLLTPDYAAPEWLAGGAATTAVDVYALGVLAYELLAGHKPYRLKRGAQALSELADTAITAPSATVERSLPDARSRKRALRGDVDRVVMTAMAAEPSRRYATVEALATDLRRWLGGRAVAARGDSPWYRLRKFVARNRVATATAAVAVLALLAATAFSLHQAHAARQQAARAETVTQFLTDMFRFADPKSMPGGVHMTALQMLDAGAQRYDRALQTEPALAAKFATTLGTIYSELGKYDRAIALAGEALKQPGIDRGARAQAQAMLARAHYEKGDYAGAKASLAQAKALHLAEDGEHSASVAADIALAGEIARRKGDYKQAEKLTKQALAMSRAALPAPNAQIAAELSQLATLYGDMRRINDARAPTEEALAMLRQLYGDNHLDVAENLTNLGAIDMQTGRLDEAVPLFKQAEAIYRRLVPGDYPALAQVLTNHARALERAGHFRDAQPIYEQALGMQRRLFGDNHPDIAATLNNMAVLNIELGQFRSAVDGFRKVLAIWKKQGKPNHPLAQISRIHLGSALRELGDTKQSETVLRAARKLAQKTFGEQHPVSLMAGISLGVTLRSEGDIDAALAVQREVDAIVKNNAKLPTLFRSKATVQYALSELAAGDPAAARKQMQWTEQLLKTMKTVDPAALGELLLANARINIASGNTLDGCKEAAQALVLRRKAFGKDNVRSKKAEKIAMDPACHH